MRHRWDSSTSRILQLLLVLFSALAHIHAVGNTAVPCTGKRALCGCVFRDEYNEDRTMQISLSALNGKNGEPYFSHILGPENEYFINLCTGFNYPRKSKGQEKRCTDATGCRMSLDRKDISSIAHADNVDFGDYHRDNVPTLTVKYNQTSDGSQMIVFLYCRKDVEGRVEKIWGSPLHRYYVRIYTRHACPTPYTNPDATNEKLKLSIGSIILIAFFAIFVPYFLIGILYKACVKKETGANAIPHASFWCGLVILIRGGCHFCCGKFTKNTAVQQ